MDLSVSCHLFLPSAIYPLPEMNTTYVYRQTWGGLGWIVGISKSFFSYISACVVPMPIFNLQLCWENVLILDLKCALPQGSKRVAGREIKPVSLCFYAACALWQQYTPHTVLESLVLWKSLRFLFGGVFDMQVLFPEEASPLQHSVSLILSLFPILYMILRKTAAWKEQEKLKLQWKSQL